MGPAKSGGIGASAGAVAATVIAAMFVVMMIAFGGGLSRPLVTPHPHVALSQGVKPLPASRSQG